jgi:hypothetical protein
MSNVNFLLALKIGITGYLALIGILLLFYILLTGFVKFFTRSDSNGSEKGEEKLQNEIKNMSFLFSEIYCV